MASDTVVRRSRASDRELLGRGRDLIARQLRRAPKEFTLGGAGTVLYAVMTIVSSVVIGWITDSVLLPAVAAGEVTAASLAGAAAVVLGVAAARGVGITGRRVGAYAAQYRLQSRDRIEVTDRYLELPLEWHRRHPTGQLLSNVNADVEAASFVAAPLPMAFGVIVMLAITAVLLVVTDLFLALVGFAVGPLIAVANFFYQRRMRIAAATAQRLRAEVAEIAHESFDAALVVKTLGREQAEVGRFGERSDVLRDRMVEVGRLRAAFDPVIEALPNLGILAVLAVGAWRVQAGVLTPGDLVTFAYLFRLVALPMRVFGWLLGELPRSVVGLERIESVLRSRDRVEYGTTGLDSSTTGAKATAEAVVYRYPESATAELDASDSDAAHQAEGDGRGVESITLQVRPGATVALVGPTGSGKSTVASLMARLFDPGSGEIRLDGRALLDLDRDVLSGTIALVFQEAFLFDDTVWNNITLSAEHSREEVEWAARLARADEFINELDDGYETLVGERGATLSGGQRQRIALARALVRRPRVLVLDDATSAVDPAVEGDILEGLARLDTTVLIVAYRRSSIMLADEVIFVEDGRVVDRGPHDVLYRTVPAYASLIDAYDSRDSGMTATTQSEQSGGVAVQEPTEQGPVATIRRGLRLSPELRSGLPGTLVLALIATAGRVVVPVAVQQILDGGVTTDGVDMAFVLQMVGLAAAAVVVTAGATGWMHLRLAKVSETALSGLRIRAFRHIHDLSMLHQASEQRGSLVSRVTSDVDEISRFMQWAGLMLITNGGQALVAIVVMLIYSPPLAGVVIVLIPLIVITIRWFQRRLDRAYRIVREKVARLLAVLAEAVVGAPVIRAYGIERRTRSRLGDAIEEHRSAAVKAGTLSASLSGAGEFLSAIVVAAVLVTGTVFAVNGWTTAGTVVAFLFLVQLFVQPVQILGEAVNEAQNAVAGWRRVLDVLDITPDVVDPGPDGIDLPKLAVGAGFESVTFRYPRPGETPASASGRPALDDVSVEIAPRSRVAVVGETGSGKTTFAKLLTRLMDPSDGCVRIAGHDARSIRFRSLRDRVVMVPQEGMLFRGSIADNVRMGRPEATTADLLATFAELGLTEWLGELEAGLDTQVGERGAALSVGERQLVTLVRAAIADPDLLVLDEATSAVDPATEMRISRALSGLTEGRTVVTIAHRMSTAESADRVLVFDRARIVQDGPHASLVEEGGVYGALYDSWRRGTADVG